ncbi:MAG: ferredoxin [Zetaproteobacteria bacterium CG_4_9_14_3_um_filter_49_83]|nr:MAG: ferredoxin [Zetaproteobacteria bacterium CG1_02_49_23]PIQ31019.1 MAG: ferredoxin [Zetaproteobacteria bacterium CG17_big_fil_post_rev_8_21_14_2_50_50_13]PIV29626.1 MAG: ferredoxin [Zetaproteobacteria bacterium CG02_land_8_20_14_3_00_50_9]PIY56928.1 MAG: ferredoxin [Zetaproteobacteria bacterium CG_4_10_14_0_8_um_filter_49_80]PJA35882.1 MAG: ferredoxin [Zetaproteobacteria bacterium CG_4_9_14_3_um_filter_49_83]
MPKPKKHVFICVQNRPAMHPRGSCVAKGATAVYEAFARQFEKEKLFGEFALTTTGCLGPCMKGPTVLVYPDGVMYAQLKPEDVPGIIEQHLKGGKPVEDLMISPNIWG